MMLRKLAEATNKYIQLILSCVWVSENIADRHNTHMCPKNKHLWHQLRCTSVFALLSLKVLNGSGVHNLGDDVVSQLLEMLQVATLLDDVHELLVRGGVRVRTLVLTCQALSIVQPVIQRLVDDVRVAQEVNGWFDHWKEQYNVLVSDFYRRFSSVKTSVRAHKTQQVMNERIIEQQV